MYGSFLHDIFEAENFFMRCNSKRKFMFLYLAYGFLSIGFD